MSGDGVQASEIDLQWSREQQRAFERALKIYYFEQGEIQWIKIASIVPGKTPLEVKRYYERFVEDISMIHAGVIALPDYPDDVVAGNAISKRKHSYSLQDMDSKQLSKSKSENERRRGTPWTVEEHKAFLHGLEKHGRGDWRSIATQFVKTRTPTQVASHAQKYFNRQNTSSKERRRSSIHDITILKDSEVSDLQKLLSDGVSDLGGASDKSSFPQNGITTKTNLPEFRQPVNEANNPLARDPLMINPFSSNGHSMQF